MIKHSEIGDIELRKLIKHKKITLAGNKKLQIYGELNCTSGKRMRKENRLFFASIIEAKNQGFRPCGHCMREQYKMWKNGLI